MVFLTELVNLSNQIQLRGYASLKKKFIFRALQTSRVLHISMNAR